MIETYMLARNVPRFEEKIESENLTRVFAENRYFEALLYILNIYVHA